MLMGALLIARSRLAGGVPGEINGSQTSAMKFAGTGSTGGTTNVMTGIMQGGMDATRLARLSLDIYAQEELETLFLILAQKYVGTASIFSISPVTTIT